MTTGTNSRASLLGDLIGGLSLAGLMVPEGIAYSAIAGLPATFGITAAIGGPLAYAFLGRSRLAVVTATSGAAALVAAAAASTDLSDVPRIQSALALTLLVGLFFIIGAALRISSLTSFISRAVLHGFGLGLAITICARQLPLLLGLKIGSGSIWQIMVALLSSASAIHAPSALLGIGALLFLATARRLKFAGSSIALVVIAVICMHFAPADHFGIALAGAVNLEAVLPRVPMLAPKVWERLAQLALPIAIVILAESWATIRSLAVAAGDRVDPRREMMALGLANLASALFRGLPVGAGFSIGNANEQAGGRSRLAAIVGALTVALVVLAARDWVALVPQPILAAIVITALSHALSLSPLRSLFRLGRDQWIAVLATVGVLGFGIVNGLLLAVGLSIVGLLRRLAHPKLSELGRTGGHDFVDCAAHDNAKQVEGLLVIRPNAPLFFGNAEPILTAVVERARTRQAVAIVLSLEETDDLDSTSVEALRDLLAAVTAERRSLILARVHDRVRTMLERGGLSALAATATFSVDDAVRAAEKTFDRKDAGHTSVASAAGQI